MSQPPLLDVRGFSLEFRTRSGTVRALEGVDLLRGAAIVLGDKTAGIRAIQLHVVPETRQHVAQEPRQAAVARRAEPVAQHEIRPRRAARD